MIPGDIREMHYNHRYCFNTDLLPALDRSGVKRQCANGRYRGGHLPAGTAVLAWCAGAPELMSRPDAPHPLFVAFLRAALNAPA
ncbi:hypothetical protein LNO81_10770 [Klebsiella variicola subsp. variicola]|nr:hypothetical protein [Klebsiella variicola subsp. variicola]